MSSKYGVASLLACLLCGAWSAATSSAAIRIGPDIDIGSMSAVGCSSDLQPATCSNATLPAGALVSSPIDGVVVRWRVQVTGTTTATFRVLRGASAGALTGAGSSSTSPPFSERGEFPTRLPIGAGDRIGVDLPPFKGPCAEGCLRTGTGGSIEFWRPPLDDGESGRGPSATSNSSFGLINADVEPDADRDGFGDETQDNCPGSAGAGEGCPPVPTTAPTPPRVRLGGAKAQDILARGAAIVFVTSTLEGSVSATGTIARRGAKGILGPLTPASSKLAEGAETRLRLRLPRKSRRAVRRAIRNGRKLKVAVTASVSSAAGAVTTARRSFGVAAKRRRRK